MKLLLMTKLLLTIQYSKFLDNRLQRESLLWSSVTQNSGRHCTLEMICFFHYIQKWIKLHLVVKNYILNITAKEWANRQNKTKDTFQNWWLKFWNFSSYTLKSMHIMIMLYTYHYIYIYMYWFICNVFIVIHNIICKSF